MSKKQMLCLVLALCAMVLTACGQREVFDTMTPGQRNARTATEAPAQDLFGSAVVGPQDYDDGTYDPASEEVLQKHRVGVCDVSDRADAEPFKFPGRRRSAVNHFRTMQRPYFVPEVPWSNLRDRIRLLHIRS